MASYTWKPIDDLPDNWPELASGELKSLASIWQEQSARLQKAASLRQFNERLGREWAIETGIIENLYSIDRGITQLLIERGIEASLIPHGATDKPPEQVVLILKDQEEVLDGLFDFVAQRRDLSASYIKELHQALTQHQDLVQAVNGLGRRFETPLLRGDWKKHPNNPTRPNGALHEYCPPEQVASEIDRLIEMHKEHMEKDVPPEVEAAWLHHRFTQIHPFQDGNGRIARTLASLVFLRAGWFPLVIHRDLRENYIRALEMADEGDLKLLVDLFSGIERRAFVKVLSISENVLQDREPLQQVIAAAKDRLKARLEDQFQERRRIFDVSMKLEKLAFDKLHQVSLELKRDLSQFNPNYSSVSDQSTQNTDYYFKKQIIETAIKLDYYADTRTYRAWARLRIWEDRQIELIISFHALGFEFLGVMAASAFMEYRDKSEEGGPTVEGPYVLCNEVFQFSYNEAEQSVVRRFEPWLNNVVIAGLDQWRRQL